MQSPASESDAQKYTLHGPLAFILVAYEDAGIISGVQHAAGSPPMGERATAMTMVASIMSRVSFLCLISSLLATTGSSDAIASAFIPVKPPLCPSTTNLAWNYRVGGNTGVFDLPSEPDCTPVGGIPCPHYIANLNHNRFFVSNGWTDHVAYRVNFFDSEPSFDFMTWGFEGESVLSSASGSVAANTTFFASVNPSFGSRRGLLNFSSDINNQYEGFYFDQIQVCTSRSTRDFSLPNNLDLKRRYHGTLLATGDVVYLKFSASSALHYPIALWEDMNAGDDFDLLGRCGLFPTATAFDWAGVSGSAQEFFDVTGCNGTVYLAVHSFRGAGVFSIVRGIHSAQGHTDVLRAGTDFSASAAQMTTFASTLQGAMKHFYGATEGEQVIGAVSLYNSAACNTTSCGGLPCDICFRNVAGTGDASCGGTINIKQSYFADPEGVAHEFGHYKYCLGDEYVDPGTGPQWQCGHSNMARPWGDQNNFCVDMDHKRDGTVSAPVSSLPSSMSQAASAGRAVDVENVTFDNYDYQDFSFDGLVGGIITN